MRDAVKSFIKTFYVASPTLKQVFIVGDVSDPDAVMGETIIPCSPEKLIGDEWFYIGREDFPTNSALMRSPIAFGRIAPDINEEMEDYVNKIISYENMIADGFTWKNNLLISIDDDTNIIEDGMDNVNHEFNYFKYTAPYIPAYMSIKHVLMGEYARTIDLDGTYIVGDGEDFIAGLNDGAFMTIYQGHAWRHGLANEWMFTTPAPYITDRNDPERLKDNGKPSFMLLGGCDIGDFSSTDDGVETRSVAEQVTLVRNGGAIAAGAAISNTYSKETARFFGQVLNNMYSSSNNEKTSLGLIFNDAKNLDMGWYYSRYSHLYNFYGDPAITFKKNVTANKNTLPSMLRTNDEVTFSNNDIAEEPISSHNLDISTQDVKTTYNSYDSIVTYLKSGESIFSQLNTRASQPFTLTNLPDVKGQAVATFFGNNCDYIMFKNDVQFYSSDIYDLSVKFKDEGLNETNIVKPRIYIENIGDTDISDFIMFYTFYSEKEPILEDWYTPNCNISLENLSENNYRVKYDFTGTTIFANSLLPDAVGNVGGIHYRDWSTFNKEDDYSYIATSNFVTNEKITIYKNGTLVYGNPSNNNVNPIADAGDDIVIWDEYDDNAEYVLLDGTTSYDPDGYVISYKWSLNGDVVSTDVTPVFDLEIGHYVFELEIIDNLGKTSTDYVVVDIQSPYASNVFDITIGPSPIPSNTPITISYMLPDNYIDCEIKAVVYRAWDTQEFVLENTPGVAQNKVFWEWNASYFGGSAIGKVEILINGYTVKTQPILFLY